MANTTTLADMDWIVRSDRFTENNDMIHGIRENEFKALKGTTYLDHAGTTLYSSKLLEAYSDDLGCNVYGNPHSGNQSSQLSADTVEQVRYRILRHFNVDPETYSVIFTSGCTAGLKLVADAFDFHASRRERENTETSGNDVQPNARDETHCMLPREDVDCDDRCTPSILTGCPVHQVLQVAGQHSASNSVPCAVCATSPKATIASASQKPLFCYLQDNHTSVIGMRKVMSAHGANAVCLLPNQVQDFFTNISQRCCHKIPDESSNSACLFAYPAQSNFCGRKYPLSWVSMAKQAQRPGNHGNWFVLLDAAALVSTSPMDFRENAPDFVSISFYKMFGFPTGLGALLVRNSSDHVLKKTYFGGGTVKVSLATEHFHANKDRLWERFEDGTLPFLEIVALKHGFDALNRISGSMCRVQQHTFGLAQFVHHSLAALRHANDALVVTLYCATDFTDMSVQGPTITFNLRRADGSCIGHAEVDKLAQLHSIHLRTGCFCNMAACQRYLGLTSNTIKDNFKAGHVCGDDVDLINGEPTGALRVSFGYISTLADAQVLLKFVKDCFVETSTTPGAEIVSKRACSDTETTMLDMNNTKLIASEAGFVYSESSKCDYDTRAIARTGSDCLETAQRNVNVPPGDDAAESSSSSVKQLPMTTPHDVYHGDEMQEGVCPETGISANSKTQGELCNIFLYPVKSCGAFEVSRWPVGPRGLLYDRAWMVTSASGVCLSQKRAPRLCVIRPVLNLERAVFTLSAPGVESIEIGLHSSEDDTTVSTLCHSKVCGDRVQGVDCGDEAARWLDGVLQMTGLRLVRQTNSDTRLSHTRGQRKLNQHESHQGALSLANEAQYLLVSTSSVSALQQHMLARQPLQQNQEMETIPALPDLVRRFRPNIVVSHPQPQAEDKWTSVQIGRHHFNSAGVCGRCQMICIDQKTGLRTKEPLLSLTTYTQRKTNFGILLCHQPTSVPTEHIDTAACLTYLSVGDPLSFETD